VNGRDAEGWSALHWAAAEGKISAVRLLLAADVDLDARDGEVWRSESDSF
jgi:ankyrin repeat protein